MLAVVVIAAVLFGAPAVVRAPAVVTNLAADGGRVAYATGDAKADCDRVYIWNIAKGKTTRLGRRTHCEDVSTGRGIAALSIAGERVLWLHYAGGNLREWSLWTATVTRPSPRRLAFVTREADARAPIVVGDGDASRFGDLLPYAVDRAVVALSARGARRFRWVAPSRVVALSAKDGELAVAQEGGVVSVLDAAGRLLRQETFDGEIAAVKITGNALLVQRGRTLELRAGGPPRTWSLPAGAALQDADGDAGYYIARGRANAVLFSSEQGLVFTPRASQVTVENSRVVIASGRRVSVVHR